MTCKGIRVQACGRKAGPLDALQAADRPPAFRSRLHNHAVGGAPRSQDTDGTAFVIAMTNQGPMAFEAAARAVGSLDLGSDASHEWKHRKRPELYHCKSET